MYNEEAFWDMVNSGIQVVRQWKFRMLLVSFWMTFTIFYRGNAIATIQKRCLQRQKLVFWVNGQLITSKAEERWEACKNIWNEGTNELCWRIIINFLLLCGKRRGCFLVFLRAEHFWSSVWMLSTIYEKVWTGCIPKFGQSRLSEWLWKCT